MVEMSNEIKVSLGIEQGRVYNFSPKDGVVNHYYVVLNRNPQKDSEINLAPFTTKKEKVLKFIGIKKLNINTYVAIEKGECPFLPSRDNAGIDCNRLIYTTKERLIELINESNGSCDYPVLEKSLLKKVVDGVKASRMVKPTAQEAL